MAAPNEMTSVYRVLEVVFRHWRKVVLIPSAVLAFGLAVALFAPRSYRSEAKIALQVGRESVTMSPTASTGQQMISLTQMGREEEVTTAMDLMTSRGVISKVVDQIGPDYVLRGAPAGEAKEANPVADAIDGTIGAAASWAIKTLKSIDPISSREEAIIELEKNLVVDAERDSTLIVVTYSSKSAPGAKAILEALIEVYRAEHLRIHRNEGSRDFFHEQEELLRDQLDAAMDNLRAVKDEIGVASIETRRQNLEAQLQSITMAAYQAETQRQAELAELKDLRRQLDGTPQRLIASRRSVPNEGADMMREQLYALQVREADLKARYSDSHPLVVAISEQIEQAEQVVDKEQEVREETTDDINPIHRQLALDAKQKQSVVVSLEARLTALADQDAAVRRDLEKVNADGVQIAQLEREQDILKRKYFRYADNLEQARIDDELQKQNISSVSIAQTPTLAEKPVSPSKLLVALGSMVLAMAGTVGTVLALEKANDKLRSESAVEQATGVPVLAAIPESPIHGRVLAP